MNVHSTWLARPAACREIFHFPLKLAGAAKAAAARNRTTRILMTEFYLALSAIVNTGGHRCANVPLCVSLALVPAPLQLRKQQLVRDAIWDAATDLFAEQGFDETTVDDIALRAGISRRSFFRYFSSKNDLMAQGIINYGSALTEAIDACPKADPLPVVFRATVLRIAAQSAAHPRTTKIMRIAAQYPAARAAQLARMADVQDQVAAAYARRIPKAKRNDHTANILAGLTLSVLALTFRSWFDQGQPDITKIAAQIFATLDHLKL